jgi:uronate dehydrogenase
MALGSVLLTGAAGGIGSHLRAPLRERATELRITDVAPLEPEADNERVIVADLTDEAAILAAADGADAIVHLGGIPSDREFGEILGPNIVGTRNVLEAARHGGARRVVYASSNHVSGMYASGHPLDGTDPVRPDSNYGASKAFGEALARMYVDRFGLEVVCLRIGSFQPRPRVARELSTWLSPADMTRLTLAALTAPDVGFEVVYGVSANRRSWWSPEPGLRIGYEPRDDAEAYAAELEGDPGPLQGGEFAA